MGILSPHTPCTQHTPQSPGSSKRALGETAEDASGTRPGRVRKPFLPEASASRQSQSYPPMYSYFAVPSAHSFLATLAPFPCTLMKAGQADRQAGRQTDRQTGRQTDRQTETQTDRQTERQTHRQTQAQTQTPGTGTGTGLGALYNYRGGGVTLEMDVTLTTFLAVGTRVTLSTVKCLK
eukprot:gene12614-biopygen431